jgi:hypothetical protein
VLRRIGLASLLAVILITLQAPLAASALRGAPGSAEFGFGAHLDPAGPYSQDAVHLSSNLQLDWLAMDVSWQLVAPKSGAIDWSRLDPVFQTAQKNQVAVMVSLSNAPSWAITPQGPEPAKTAQFITSLLQRYGSTIRAIELFPGANTREGWSAVPDAAAYQKTWAAARTAVEKSKLAVVMVAAGLRPILANQQNQDAIDDLAFLQGLYAAGGKDAYPVVSMVSDTLTGAPLEAPGKAEKRVLRHYEEIRQVMLKNNHERGLIWITHLAPSTQTNQPDEQAQWLDEALRQVQSQLYIGGAFTSSLNPSSSTSRSIALIQPNGNYHPFYRTLRDLIAASRFESPNLRPGRPKNQPLLKSAK